MPDFMGMIRDFFVWIGTVWGVVPAWVWVIIGLLVALWVVWRVGVWIYDEFFWQPPFDERSKSYYEELDRHRQRSNEEIEDLARQAYDNFDSRLMSQIELTRRIWAREELERARRLKREGERVKARWPKWFLDYCQREHNLVKYDDHLKMANFLKDIVLSANVEFSGHFPIRRVYRMLRDGGEFRRFPERLKSRDGVQRLAFALIEGGLLISRSGRAGSVLVSQKLSLLDLLASDAELKALADFDVKMSGVENVNVRE